MKAQLAGLFTLLLSKGDAAQLGKVVDESRQKFVDDGEESVWLFWKGQAVIAGGDPEAALSLAANINDPEHRIALETVALREIAKQTKDPSRLGAYLEDLYTRTKDGLHLFELCEVKLQQKEWIFVADHADDLLTLVGTPAALRIALMGVFNAARHEQCLNLLNTNERLFPNGELPIDLKRWRVECEKQLGLINEALREAEQVARETGLLEDLNQLVGLRLAAGDTKGVIEGARAILSRKDADPKQLLQLARATYVEDSPLAQELLSKAVKSGERSAEFVVTAYDLAFRLNREDMLETLHPDFTKAAERKDGPIWTVTLADLLKQGETERARLTEVNQLYRQGRVPLHIVNKALGAIYHERFHSSDEMLGQSSPVFIRYGGRGATSGTLSPSRLYLDISSVLLAAELDILDIVEKEFAPLYLPPSITHALHRQIEDAVPHQPSIIDAMRKVQALLESGELRIANPVNTSASRDNPLLTKVGIEWLDLFQQAKQAGGRLVDYLPLQRGVELEIIQLGEEESQFVTGCGSILTSLTAEGKLTQEVQQVAQQHLSVIASREHPSMLTTGTALFLYGNIAETLASADILRETCKNFQVYIEPREAANIRAGLKRVEEQRNLQEWLRQLRDRINLGLAADRYKFIGVSNSLKPDRATQTWGPDAACLEELLHAKSASGSYVWIDDRFINAFSKCGELPVVGLLEILNELRRRKVLDQTSYFRKLHQLRKGNFRYVPLEKEEILFDLHNATERDGKIIETPELSVLRRYVASCLQDRDSLRMPAQMGKGSQPGEINVLTGLFAAAGEAIRSLWCDEKITDGAAIARADWILYNLWYDCGATPRLIGLAPHSAQERELMGGTIALLYIQAPTRLSSTDEKGPMLRAGYFDWLQNRFSTDWESNKTLGRQLSRLFEAMSPAKSKSKKRDKVLQVLLSDLYANLPETIRSHMSISSRALKRIGIKEHRVVVVANFKFEDKEFWQAAKKAVQGSVERITARDPLQEFTMRFISDADGETLRLSTGTPEKTFRMSDPLFEVLRPDVLTREKVLITHREWFDCNAQTHERQVQRLARLGDPSERITRIRHWRNNSAASFYANLEAQLAERKSLHLSDFEPPPSQGLLNHLRLPQETKPGQSATAFEAAAKSLVDEEGFAEAFLRVASLPIAVPGAIWEAHAKLSLTEQSAWLEDALSHSVSPVSRLHLLGIALSGGSERRPIAQRLLDSLLGPEGEIDYSALDKILRWTVLHLEHRHDTKNWSSFAILSASWLHATRLYTLLRKRSSKEKVAEFFEKAAQPVPNELFGSRDELRGDVAHPRQINRSTFLSRGIAAALTQARIRSTDFPGLEEKAVGLCFFKVEDKWVQRIEFLADPALQENALGSFLGGDQGETLASLIGPEPAKLLGSNQILTNAEAVLSDLLGKPDQPSKWVIAFGTLGRTKAPDSLRDKVRTFIMSINFVDLEALEPSSLRVALFTIINQVNRLDDREAAKRVKAEVQKLFHRIALSEKEMQTKPNHMATFIECAELLALRFHDPATAAREMADFLFEGIVEWPAVANNLQPGFTTLAYRLPLQVAVEFWKLIFKIRQTAA
jgi:hypothetical protein